MIGLPPEYISIIAEALLTLLVVGLTLGSAWVLRDLVRRRVKDPANTHAARERLRQMRSQLMGVFAVES